MNGQVNNYYGNMFPRPCAAGEYIYVQGIEQVREYPVAPGQTQRFMDVTELLGYIKTQPYDPRAPYDLKIIHMTIEDDPLMRTPEPPRVPQGEYVTMEQFNSLSDKLDRLLEWNEQRRNNKEDRRNDRKQPVRPEHSAE